MWDKLGAIVGIVIGTCLIVFKKRIRSLFLKKHFEEHTTPKKIEYQHKMQEMKLEGIFNKVLEIVSITVGVILILMNTDEFFPQANRYINYILGFFALSFFSAGAAAIVELTLIAPFLMRDIRKHMQERYGAGYQNIQNRSESESMDDPVLRKLRKKSFIYLAISFVVLFAIFVSAFYIIFKITS